jgi:hypothetical protein
MWGAEKVSGAYVDPTMTMALIPVSGATEDALTGASGKGAEAMSLTCEEVTSGGTLKAMEGKCYKLVFDQANAQTKFTIDATGVKYIAFFAQHLPTEFEATEHYFKDKTGADIEPMVQDPVPGADGHAHGHGGPEAFKANCVCKAKDKGWKLDCTNKAAITGAVTNLDAKAACKAENPPEDCIHNYHVMQSHHDHCLHDALPIGIELTLHAYEQFYDDCFIKRQFDPTLSKCPTVDCSDAKAMTQAVATLQAGCLTTQACADPTCSAAIKVVLMAHDVCPEDKLPNNLEVALHDHEEPCETQLCNTAGAAFNPYDASCGDESAASGPSPAPSPDNSNVNDASGCWSPEGFLVTALALPLAACSFHRK